MDSEKGNRVFARGGHNVPPPPLVFGAQKKPGLDRVNSAALSEQKVASSIPTIGDFHTVGPCKKAVFACLATDVNQNKIPLLDDLR